MAMISIGIQMNMSITDKGNLLWLYRSKPLVRPGALILGSFKALFVKYYLPAYVLLCGIFIVMLDWVILPDLSKVKIARNGLHLVHGKTRRETLYRSARRSHVCVRRNPFEPLHQRPFPAG